MMKLIASDLDGTLLRNGAAEVSQEAIELIKKLKTRGVLFTAASGRQYHSLRHLFAPIQDEIAYIAENGSLCIYQGEILSKTTIDSELSSRIIDAIRAYPDCDFIISGEQTLYTESKSKLFTDHIKNVLHCRLTVVEDVKKDVAEPFLKIAVLDHAGTEDCQNYLKNLFQKEIKIVTSGYQWVDFIAPGTNKGVALTTLLAHLGISARDCMAFGDQYNDVEMLQTAGTSYAMSTSAPGISYYSTYVTDSVEEVLRDLAAF